MLRRVRLINFMSHADTTIELKDGLNVIVGDNNIGKSAIVSALQILSSNCKSTHVIRHGEKSATVEVETSEGKAIKWTRKNSPSYTIDGEEFSRLGQGNVPDELHQILKLPKVQTESSLKEFDVHFGEQKSPVFLFNESDGVIAQFFAASSDASKLIKMQKLHKQKLQSATTKKRELTQDLAQINKKLDVYKNAEELEAKLKNLKEQNAKILSDQTTIANLTKQLKTLKHLSKTHAKFQNQLSAVRTVPAPPKLSKTEKLEELQLNIGINRRKLDKLKQAGLTLNNLTPPVKLNDVSTLMRTIPAITCEIANLSFHTNKYNALKNLPKPPQPKDTDKIKSLCAAIKEGLDAKNALSDSLTKIESDIKHNEQEIAKIAICPTCGQKISGGNCEE